MAKDGFVTAVPPNGGEKRRVPEHYLLPPFNYKLPPSTKRVREPAAPATIHVQEPAEPGTDKEVTE
ncbi:hypothetical protein [Arthrobacter sp. 31Y]|uniref:hypothetical protein n=1 Tax=Arthrobacter sp. 31Y TaxID=1115632 RepID=UPI0004642E09|nr:hypothetical protein [Arthrobacter sp. 31Y]